MLDEYLRRGSAGLVETSGRITIDYRRARRLVGRYRLPGRVDYLLKLIQAGVQAHCSWVEVNLSPFLVEVVYRGFRPDSLGFDEIPAALCRPFRQAAGSAFEALVVGLDAAMAQGARPTIDSDLGGISRRLTLGPEETAFSVLPPSASVPHPSMRISLQLPLRTRGPEIEEVLKRCRYSPVQVLLNGRDLRECPEYGAALQRVVNRDLAGVYVSDRLCTGFFVCRGSDRPSRVSFVRHGVVTETIQVELDLPGVDVVWSADAARTDLSGMQVQRDPWFEQSLAEIAGEGKKLSGQPVEAPLHAEATSSAGWWVLLLAAAGVVSLSF